MGYVADHVSHPSGRTEAVFHRRNGTRVIYRLTLLATLSVLLGCADREVSIPNDDIGGLAKSFVDEPEFRRHALERSFVNPNNGYSQLRSERYSEDVWGRLAVWKPPPSPSLWDESLIDDAGASIDIESVPWTAEGLRALGEYAFFNYPGQLNQVLHEGISSPSTYGLDVIDGRIDTLVWVETATGHVPAVTCATCHSRLDEQGQRIAGRPNGAFNYGKMIEEYAQPGSEAGAWGPGRVDVTRDGTYNPTAITDLRPISLQKYLHRAGTLHNDLSALAVRIETLMITSKGQKVRLKKAGFCLSLLLMDSGRRPSIARLGPSCSGSL